jgi:ABC-type branched-subunit amino acid transport system substrate-binding protein
VGVGIFDCRFSIADFLMRERPFPTSHSLLPLLCLALLAATLPAGSTAHAQEGGGDLGSQEQADVPRIEEAEQVFQRGIEAFEAGDYGTALQRFEVAINSYPLHRKTTAAALMAAKALYRQGEYARADERLSRFLREYPSSSYVGAARRVRSYAREQLGLEGSGAAGQTLQLGIALPLDGQNAALTQAMFNGIEQAVARANGGEYAPGTTVRMMFQNTQAAPQGAREAVGALAEAGADVVIGPLFSRTARPAGAVAEEERLTMVTPLAGDRGVSQGRRYVFQANPTIAMRGRQMARFAQESLREDRFGVVSQPEGTQSYTLAEHFRREAERLGATVTFSDTLPGLRAYGRLNERISAQRLQNAGAVYLPVSGEQAPRLVQAALTALDRAEVPRLRVLGNSAWDDQPIEQSASRYRVTYASPFEVDPSRPEVQTFIEDFRAATGQTPDQLAPPGRRLAYTGYDVARFLIGARARSTDAAQVPSGMREALLAAPRYEGLGVRIQFEGGTVNQGLFYQRYRDGRLELMR